MQQDAFDLGQEEEIGRQGGGPLANLTNPGELLNALDLSIQQKRNVKSLIVGSGTGAIHQILEEHLGTEISAAIGGLVSGFLARKLMGR